MAKFYGTRLNDVLQGGAEADRMYGRDGNDLLIGDANADWLSGGKGDDGFYGGGGSDTIKGDSGNDTMFGDGGNDRLYGGTGNDTLFGGADDDYLSGGKGDDVLDGGSGNDTLFGDTGNDLLWASTGNDSYTGGAGFDTVDFSRLAGRLEIDLSTHSARILDGSNTVVANSRVVSVEKVVGTSGDDSFKGSSKGETLEGGAGNDLFRSLSGADTLSGGSGIDTFTWLKKDVADGRMDHITDFQAGVDRLDLHDFLKGQGIKGAQYDDVIRIADAPDHSGAVVQGLAGGRWVDVVQLDHLDASGLSLADLGL